MAIDPNAITTVRVGQLAEAPFANDNNIPHEVNGVLKRGSIEDLTTYISTLLGTSEAVGYLPISIVDGQQLPDVPENPSFFLCGKGTFLNINGFDDLVCSEDLNVIMSVVDHWEVAVEIPINVDVSQIGISQEIRQNITQSAPSENAVFNALNQYLNSVGSFLYADLTTQTTPLNGIANVEKNLINDIDGTNTDLSNAPYGVSTLWDSATNKLDFSQLSIGDVVNLRTTLKVTTSTANQNIHIFARLGLGTASEKDFLIGSKLIKTAGEFIFDEELTIVMSKEDWITDIGELYLISEHNSTIKVNEFEFVVTRKNINVIDIDGLTDLSATRTPSNVTINSSTGAPAVVGLGNGTNAGVSLNDYTSAEKSKLVGISTGANVGVVPNTTITGATKTKITYDSKGLVTNGADLIESDIPTLGQSKITNLTTDLGLKAPLASPTFTGSVVVPNGSASTEAVNKGQLDAVSLNSALIPLNEGGGIGYVINGRTAANYGNIGNFATDLSNSDATSSVRGATGLFSFATGFNTRASGQQSVALNSGTIASGIQSLATGNSTTASSQESTAMGGFTTASGVRSMSVNDSTIASGYAGFASGSSTEARSFVEAVFGRLNTLYTPSSTTAWVATDRLFGIGNGTSGPTVRSDAFIILKNGLTTLPSVTNALIIAEATGKAIATKEFVEAKQIQRLAQYTVATLPTGAQGDLCYVTDALTPTYLGTVVGGGSVVCKVFFNGTNWIT
jgi:hypothetical protein